MTPHVAYDGDCAILVPDDATVHLQCELAVAWVAQNPEPVAFGPVAYAR